MTNTGDVAVRYMKPFLGTLYLWGGIGPNRVDCSGLGYQAYRRAGKPISRTTYTQVNEGTEVKLGNHRPGDGIYLRWVNGRPEHVIWVITATTAIHAPGRGRRVEYVDLRAKIAASGRYEIRRFAPYADVRDNREPLRMVNLRVGKSGKTVRRWEQFLEAKGHYRWKRTGKFGLRLWTATRSFEKARGLPRMTGRQVKKATVSKAGFRPE